jgi:hypothetical protein
LQQIQHGFIADFLRSTAYFCHTRCKICLWILEKCTRHRKLINITDHNWFLKKPTGSEPVSGI